VEAQRLGFKPLVTPGLRWTHGKVPVQPPPKSDAEPTTQIENATKVWVVGATKDKALVTINDPRNAKLSALLGKVAGWVPVNRLTNEDTTTWLPPESELVGFHVWAPFEPPSDIMQLGTIAELAGQDVTVARLADGQKVKVKRDQIRAGRLPAGTKVLTFCLAKDQPAKVVEVTPSGQSAKLKCDGGQEKEDDLSALKSKPNLLPPAR
jgi:hypothetical protein